MPVQINEVIVRTTVDTKEPCAPDADSGTDHGNLAGSQSEIIERVLEIIREGKER